MRLIMQATRHLLLLCIVVAHSCSAHLKLCRSDSDSDGEKEAMRQALSNSTSNASEEAAAAGHAGANGQASP